MSNFMKKDLGAGSLLVIFLLPLMCVAADNSSSLEFQAYRSALTFLKQDAQAGKAMMTAKSQDESKHAFFQGPFEKKWDNQLKVLTLSSSEQGDKYLVKLAFFKLDGVVGEDFSCAISHRLAKHGVAFMKYLQEARDNYEKINPCKSNEFNNENDGLLSCISKEQFANLVKGYEPYAGKPEDSSDVDCSYLFK